MRFKEVKRNVPKVYEIYSDHKELVGHMLVIIFEDRGCYCESINILEEYRNQGYTTATLRQLSRDRGFVLVAPANENARRFCECLGYVVTEGNNCYFDRGFGVYEI